MANTKSAAKFARTSDLRRKRNNAVKSEIKTKQKSLKNAIVKGDKEQTAKAFSELTSKLDSAAKRGIIHKNAANRSKSRIAKSIKATPATV